MQAFEDELLGAIRERPAGEPVLAAFGRFVLEPRGFLAATDAGAAEELASVSRMIAGSPAVLAREAQIQTRYTDIIAAAIADETGADRDDPRPWVTANALIGVHRALIAYLRQRILTGHDGLPGLAHDVRSYGETALALLSHGLGGYAPDHQMPALGWAAAQKSPPGTDDA